MEKKKEKKKKFLKWKETFLDKKIIFFFEIQQFTQFSFQQLIFVPIYFNELFSKFCTINYSFNVSIFLDLMFKDNTQNWSPLYTILPAYLPQSEDKLEKILFWIAYQNCVYTKINLLKAVNASSGIVFLFGECNYLLLLLLTYLFSITVVYYHSKKDLTYSLLPCFASTTCQPFFGIQSLMLFSDCLHHLYSIYMLYLLFLYILHNVAQSPLWIFIFDSSSKTKTKKW